MTGISDELVQRMVEVIREMDDAHEVVTRYTIITQRDRWITKARGIAAELPKPVDPEKERIREIMRSRGFGTYGTNIPDDASNWDNLDNIWGLALFHFRTGREYERKLQAEGR